MVLVKIVAGAGSEEMSSEGSVASGGGGGGVEMLLQLGSGLTRMLVNCT